MPYPERLAEVLRTIGGIRDSVHAAQWVVRLRDHQEEQCLTLLAAAISADTDEDPYESILHYYTNELVTWLTTNGRVRRTPRSKADEARRAAGAGPLVTPWAKSPASAAAELKVWPPTVPTAKAIDAVLSLNGAVESLRRTHQRQILATLMVLRDPDAIEGTTTLATALTKPLRAARALHRDLPATASPGTLLSCDWGGGGGSGPWFTVLDDLIATAASQAGVDSPGRWAANLHFGAPGSTAPMKDTVLRYLRTLEEQFNAVDPAWIPPAGLVGGTRTTGHDFIRPITVNRGTATLDWDDWITGDGRKTHAILVIGDPGYGKTTLTRWEAASAASAAIATGRIADGAIPLWTTCRRLGGHVRETDGLDLDTPLATALASLARIDAPLIADLVRDQPTRIFAILDSMDEAADGLDVLTLNKIISNHDGIGRVLLTTRPILYPTRFIQSGATAVILQPLDEDQVSRLIGRWYTAGPQTAERRKAREALRLTIEGNPQIGSLASIPLFAVLLCTVYDPERLDVSHDGHPTHRLRPGETWHPQTRAELLWAAVVDRLWGVGIINGYGEIAADLGNVVADAAHIAHITQTSPTYTRPGGEGTPASAVSQEQLERMVRRAGGPADQVARLLTSVRGRGGSGLLTLNLSNVDWVHEHIREYLVAHHVAGSLDEEAVLTAVRDHIDDDGWAEVLRLLPGELARRSDHQLANRVIREMLNGHDLGLQHSIMGVEAAKELPPIEIHEEIMSAARAQADLRSAERRQTQEHLKRMSPQQLHRATPPLHPIDVDGGVGAWLRHPTVREWVLDGKQQHRWDRIAALVSMIEAIEHTTEDTIDGAEIAEALEDLGIDPWVASAPLVFVKNYVQRGGQ